MPKRLKAFTLLELLVAMAITGMVISIAGMVYNMLNRQFYTYRKTNEQLANVFALNNRLALDFMDASVLERIEGGIKVQRPGKDVIEYLLDEKLVLRIDPYRTDTFHVGVQDAHYTFKGQEQVQGVIDELKFDAMVFGEKEPMHFTRDYGAYAEMNKEEESNGN